MTGDHHSWSGQRGDLGIYDVLSRQCIENESNVSVSIAMVFTRLSPLFFNVLYMSLLMTVITYGYLIQDSMANHHVMGTFKGRYMPPPLLALNVKNFLRSHSLMQ